MNTVKTIFLVTALLLFTFIIRIWRVTEAPASVNWDEAAVGYNAFSLLETGRDEFGKALPVSLRSFDDYKPALYSYLSAVPVRFSGLTELSTRLTSVIYGTILVFAVLYLASKLTGSLKLGLIAGVFAAASPWAVHFSRIAFEANLGVGLYYLAIAVFVFAFRRPKACFWSLFLFILSMYAYHAQRAIALPTFLALWLIFRSKIPRLTWLSLAALLPLAVSFITEPAGSRLASTIIFKLWPFVPTDLPKLIYNPILTLMWQLTGQFGTYYSPVNIFVRGSTEPILRIPTLGLLQIELLPLWITGLIHIFRPQNINKLLWIILLLAPLPGVITWNWFSVVRTLAVYPALAILAAFGYRWLKISGLVKAGLWITFGLSALYTILTIGIYAPYETYGDFQPGFKTAIPYLLSEAKNYRRVVVDSPHIAPYIFLLFYGQYPPDQYLAEAGPNRKNSGTEDYAFGKFEFRKITAADQADHDILLMGPTVRLPDYWVKEVRSSRPVRVADFPDVLGYTSFRVVSL